jgi:DNA adenine methylase Dam
MILKSPTNYAGSKDKLMSQLLKYFPEDVDTFYDVFCGGLSVSINSPYQRIIANDIITPLIQFYQSLYFMSINDWSDKEIEIIKSFKIDKTSKEQFLKVREEFNVDGNPYKFFALISSCTNNMMRFNKRFKFNQTFGERTINDNTIQKLNDYCKVMKNKNFTFTNLSYPELFKQFPPNQNDFVYLDPPYLISEAGYNAYWSKELEEGLYKLLDELDSKGVKFMMSNVSKHKGKENPHLDKIKKFNIIELDFDYEKVARKKGSDSQEIIVMNF